MLKAWYEVEEIYKAQLADIKGAKRSIFFEQYIVESLEPGEIGRQYVDALVQKAKDGVHVQCILDAQGAFDLYTNNELYDALINAGCKIFFYKTLGKFNMLSPPRLFLRDHRKLLIIDDEITWIGGTVVGERFRTWKDLMVRFTEAAIAEVCGKEFRNQVLRLQDKRSLLAPLATISAQYHITGNAPGIGNRFCYEEICHAIMRAQKSVVLVTPYFAPSLKLERILRRRLADGLSITLIMPSKSDKSLADFVREQYFNTLLKKGLKVEYIPGMLHAKIVLVDDIWVTFGSTNLDALSLVFNHELNMVTNDPDAITQVREGIAYYRKDAQPHTMQECPYKSYGLLRKCAAYVFRFIV